VSEKYRGLEIKPRPNEEPDKYIKRFLKKVRNDGILQEVFLRRAYEKPSIKRRRKSARARFLKRIEEQAS
jgi:small subunit ribosomal protein S21